MTPRGVMRMGSNAPVQYRLKEKSCGELVLQGMFSWEERNYDDPSKSCADFEWRDLETVRDPKPAKLPWYKAVVNLFNR